MRILCAADIHIGRTSTKLPESLDSSGFTCSDAWNRVVDCALTSKADCIICAGDLIDRGNSRFEALGSLEKGVRRLEDAGITVYAVTGNHDYRILPQIADYLHSPVFRVLGTDGNWEVADRSDDIRIVGKSFTRANGASDVLASFPEPGTYTRHTIAIIHSSLSSGADPYMPVAPDALSSIARTVWIVGHIHQSVIRPNIIIPGSVQALSPRETGSHGVVIADIDANGIAQCRRIGLSTARYEDLTVELDEVDNELEIKSRIQRSLDPLLAEDNTENSSLNMLSLRITLTGRTGLYRSMPKIAEDLGRNGSLDLGEKVYIEKIEVATAPPIDLEDMAKSDDVLGRLAKLIRAIDSGQDTDGLQEITQKACARANDVYSDSIFSPVSYNNTDEDEDQIPDRQQIIGIVRNKAFGLLSTLVSQRESP